MTTNDYFNIFMLLLTLYLLFGFIITLTGENSVEKTNRHHFMSAALLTAGATIFEYIENNVSGEIANTSNLLEFCIVPYILYILSMALTSNQGSIRTNIIKIIVLVNVFLEVINQFCGFIFFYDRSFTYHRGKFYFLYLIVNTACIILCLLEFYHKIKASNSKLALFKTINLFFLLIFCIAFQVVIPNVVVIKLGIVLAIQQFYTIYQTADIKTDELTKLLAHRIWILETENIKEKARPCAIILFDVGDFKHINDTFGHTAGDICLKKIAELIYKNFSSTGLCFRKGGDEFGVIFECMNYIESNENIDIETTNSPDLLKIIQQIHNFEDDIEKEIELHKNNLTLPEFPWVDIGYAINTSQNNIEEIIKIADENLYKNKRVRKYLAKK